MHTLEQIYSRFPKDFFNLGIKTLHHNGPSGLLLDSEFYNDKKIKISSDLVLIQINDKVHQGTSRISRVPFENPDQLIEIIEEPYIKWISKPRALVSYIEANYDKLPEYIMYIDASDVVVIEDILNPKEMLDFYQCDILFNSEPSFNATGYCSPSHQFYDDLFIIHKEIYKDLNLKKYGIAHERAINAGVFLGRKDAILEICKEACYYMSGDQSRGFPWGCEDDQYMFRFLQTLFFDKIGCDIYNKWFLFAYPKAIENPDEEHWEHFLHFPKNYLHLYKK